MKNRMIAATLLCVVATLAGCNKDKEEDGIPENAMLLNAEGFDGQSKTTVNGTAVAWKGGESVKLNGTNYTVSVSGGKAYVSGSDALKTATTVYGYNPASIVTSDEATTSPTVTLPSIYDCSFSGSNQVIDLPMAAYTTESDGTAIRFKHLTAAVKVHVRNNTGSTFYLDSVVITSTKYQICGAKTLDLTASNLGLGSATLSDDASKKTVRIHFGFNAVTIADGATKDVQVPILPVTNTETFTVKVYTHKINSGGVAKAHNAYNYSRDDIPSPALARNRMATLNVDMVFPNTVDNAYVTQIVRGIFTTQYTQNSTTYTRYNRFAQGNLQWTGNTKKYSFATNQYDAILDAVGNTTSSGRSSQNYPIDLFGWGTSGYKHNTGCYRPYETTTTASQYYVNDAQGNNLYYNSNDGYADWGTYASSLNNSGNYSFVSGITGTWITFRNTEWTYLLNTRATGATVNGTSNARYTCATLYYDKDNPSTNIRGVLIFPDNFEVPTFTAGSSWSTINGKTDYKTKIYPADWQKLEVLGCVFLPVTGYRSNTTVSSSNLDRGYYWSSVQANSNDANTFYFQGNTGFTPSYAWKRFYGCAVRLVKRVSL